QLKISKEFRDVCGRSKLNVNQEIEFLNDMGSI
ncbi:MAG: hypothetical protein RLZZ44_1239, partial [Bacteroidota bacterium]